ncbi:hypothetical protein T440DRAFT_540127 [Plenodomus tracheiphilus IPT5]|uniref:RNase III domain-containing protein n=1 Tax=Plenodomus tracheiphilus IPT5 TaxID=1408161 RepID=A0A6A7AWQ9_9PLEO|nr:hypothetical protein T440DRAFT_540127 [Plenodomus tracheiphilus IPT5]
MLDFFQSRIKYKFENEELMKSALRSAHRDRDDGVLDDGNRCLAHYGVSTISMVESYNAVVGSGMTLHDFNKRDYWSKTKKGRAKACRALGFEPFIIRSVRQQHQPASETVLDNAFSAIIGAIWLDCEARGKSTADTRCTVWKVLREMDAILESSSSSSGENDVLLSMNNDSNAMIAPSFEQSNTTDLISAEQLGDIDNCTHDRFAQALIDSPFGELPYEYLIVEPQGASIQASVEADSTLPREDCLFSNIDEHVITSSAQDISACAELGTEFDGILSTSHYDYYGGPIFCSSEPLQNIESNATTPVTCAKRKRTEDSVERANSTYLRVLDLEQQKLDGFSQYEKERLARYLDHPEITKLEKESSVLFRFFYLAIGSWQTIDDFKNQLRLARNVSSVHKRPRTSIWSAAQTYNEICRLEKEEALSVLLRRYHTINLCVNEKERHQYCSNMIVETLHTVGVARRSNPGNPVLALDAIAIDQLLYKSMPDAQPETNDFKKARRRVKRLRKLARHLHILVQDYGFGILALLPSGPSFEELSLTDNMFALEKGKPVCRKFSTSSGHMFFGKRYCLSCRRSGPLVSG